MELKNVQPKTIMLLKAVADHLCDFEEPQEQANVALLFICLVLTGQTPECVDRVLALAAKVSNTFNATLPFLEQIRKWGGTGEMPRA